MVFHTADLHTAPGTHTQHGCKGAAPMRETLDSRPPSLEPPVRLSKGSGGTGWTCSTAVHILQHGHPPVSTAVSGLSCHM